MRFQTIQMDTEHEKRLDIAWMFGFLRFSVWQKYKASLCDSMQDLDAMSQLRDKNVSYTPLSMFRVFGTYILMV